MTYLIQSGEGEGLPHYYSPMTARLTGAAHGWTQIIRDAVRFETEEDALKFAEKKLGYLPYHVVKHG